MFSLISKILVSQFKGFTSKILPLAATHPKLLWVGLSWNTMPSISAAYAIYLYRRRNLSRAYKLTSIVVYTYTFSCACGCRVRAMHLFCHSLHTRTSCALHVRLLLGCRLCYIFKGNDMCALCEKHVLERYINIQRYRTRLQEV